MRVALVSTPVGPLGSGIGGGVELTIRNLAAGLRDRGHQVTIVAPEGSVTDVAVELVTVPGRPQVPGQHRGRDAPVELPASPVLGAMWDRVRELTPRLDVAVNLAYDWLPLYLTPFLAVPVAHLVSMGSLSDAIDEAIAAVLDRAPSAVAVHTRAQAATFPFGDRLRVVGNGIDLARYHPVDTVGDHLAWVGRVSPEKGLEDAVALAARTSVPLVVYGLLQDPAYWQACLDRWPGAPVRYGGFLPTAALQAELARAAGLVLTPKWVEAFGNVVVEALACGTPVVTYDRGGPAELVVDGVTGFVVPPDSVDALVVAVGRLGGIDRRACRAWAERECSLDAMAARMEAWFAAMGVGG